MRLPHSAGDMVGQLYFQKHFLGGVLLIGIPKKISKFTENIYLFITLQAVDQQLLIRDSGADVFL